VAYLPNVDRRRNTAEPHASKMQKVETLYVVTLCAVYQGLGHEHLAAVRGIHYSCSAVHGWPEVVAVACLRLARVQAAAQFQWEVGFPPQSLNATLQLDRCHQRLNGIGEHGVQTVAGRFYDPAAPLLDDLAAQGVMARQQGCHPRWLRFPQGSTALDVGE